MPGLLIRDHSGVSDLSLYLTATIFIVCVDALLISLIHFLILFMFSYFASFELKYIKDPLNF